MADKYANWEELISDRDPTTGELVNQEGRDWYIRIRPGTGSYVTHMAIHGGVIEAPPEQLADYAAQLTGPFYTFAGIKSSGNTALHITSTHYDEPQAVQHAAGADRIVSWHGHADKAAGVAVTYVGGLDAELGDRIRARLEEADFRCEDPPADLSGTDPDNICNRGLRSAGVQLELSRSQRAAMFAGGDLRLSRIQDPANRTTAFYRYVAAVNRGVADVVPLPVAVGITAAVVTSAERGVQLTVTVAEPTGIASWQISRVVGGLDQPLFAGQGNTLPFTSTWFDASPPACVPITYRVEVRRQDGTVDTADSAPVTYTPEAGCGGGAPVGEVPTVLGCASTYSALIHWRGGGQQYAMLSELTAVKWSRTINDISEASVTIARASLDPACCEDLGQVEPWCHELTIYRDGELVWQGPIVRPRFRRDSITIEAQDVTAWLDHLVNNYPIRYINAGADALGRRRGPITYIADNHLRLNLTDPDLSVPRDYPSILDYLVRRDEGLPTIKVEKDGSDNQTAWTETMGNIWREWTKRGLTWTTVGRSIVLRGRPTSGTRAIGRLTLDHIAGDVEVIKDGTQGATYGWATSQQFQNITDGKTLGTGRTGTPYGRLDTLVTLQEEDVTDADLRSAARDALAGRYPVPVAINVPDQSQLTPDAPVTVQQLVPGERLDVLASSMCVPIERGFVLSDVDVSWQADQGGQGGERVGIALIPLGDVDEELGG
ncbi:poly-gamma-glutamate hydrolase family protein [Streptomyces sp. NPDC058045]|uniref:poly-gamma-glutamate hydrolase family protein n=1 Tax=Streptomyces sp. NPDC058045 TaxID=3346311 RepID=UPI0036E5F3AD